MKKIILMFLYLAGPVYADSATEQCNDVSKLIKHVYSPNETHIKRSNYRNKWGIDVKTNFFKETIDKNHPLYGKPVLETLYCLDDSPEICDKNNSWLPIDLVKISITKGKKVICQSSSNSLNIVNGKQTRKSTFYFYTEN